MSAAVPPVILGQGSYARGWPPAWCPLPRGGAADSLRAARAALDGIDTTAWSPARQKLYTIAYRILGVLLGGEGRRGNR